MGSRPYYAPDVPQVKTRKQKKSRWIYQKNQLRLSPGCVVAGEAYCDDWGTGESLDRADVMFFHTRKRRYFYAQLVTPERMAFELAEQEVRDKLDQLHPFPETMFASKETIILNKNKVVGYRTTFTPEFEAACRARDVAAPSLFHEISKQSLSIPVRWEVKDVDAVSAYIDAVVDVPVINENVIRDFIEHFRTLGEPIESRVIFTQPDVSIDLSTVPKIIEKFSAASNA